MQSRREQLLKGNITKLLFKFSAPAIIGMIVGALYNVVDTIFVGRGVGSLAIAALSIVLPIQLIMIAIGIMVGVGAASIISRALGGGKKDIAIRTVGNGIILSFIFNAAIIIAGYIFIEEILIFFGASSEVLPYALDYTSIILLGLVFFSFSISSNNFIRAEGNPRAAMYSMTIGAVANIILDPVLIFGFNMGIKGAAIATIISQALTTIYIICYFMYGHSIFRLRLSMFRIKLNIIKEILRLGFPSFLRQGAASVIILISNRVLAYYGTDLYIAIMGVGLRLLSLIQMPIIGITQGFSTIVGFNYGAKLFSRVKKTLGIAILWSVIIAGFGFIIMMLFPAQVIGIFTNDPEFIAKGIFPLRVVIIFLPLVGIQVLGGGLFQAIGKAKPALIITISRQILFLIPAVLILPIFLGVDGVWLSVPVADFMSLVITGIWLYKEVGSFTKLEVNQARTRI
ncbi:MAG: MATE family efflux transporter [Actinobacteria bacterium]|nr:MATE family efflux transporter [Actinomycetota bacterium]